MSLRAIPASMDPTVVGSIDAELDRVEHAHRVSVRPAIALRWLREYPDAAVAPMHLPTLLAQCELPDTLVTAIAEMTELKSRTREMGSGTVPMPIAQFIADEFDGATDAFPKTADRDLDRAREITAAFFRKEVLAAGDGL